jgi:endonuclease/exonuclease/phosphatase family metal-dependent hydrolase
VRIGTWNLAGRWTPAHESLLRDLDCDVLLLTEVSERLELSGYHAHLSTELMAARRRWAGILSRDELVPMPDPHPASAMARVEGLTFCSSILPWRSCGAGAVWIEGNHAAKTEHAVACLLAALPTSDLVWGGDFNHALRGREWTGSIGGRSSITAALAKLNLQVPTTDLPHQIEGLLSIDHVAVPQEAAVNAAEHVSVRLESGRLSDHDAYVVQLG